MPNSSRALRASPRYLAVSTGSSPIYPYRVRKIDSQGQPTSDIVEINSTNPDTNAWAQYERNDVDVAGFCELFESEATALGFTIPGQEVLDCLKTEIRPFMVDAVRQTLCQRSVVASEQNLQAFCSQSFDALCGEHGLTGPGTSNDQGTAIPSQVVEDTDLFSSEIDKTGADIGDSIDEERPKGDGGFQQVDNRCYL